MKLLIAIILFSTTTVLAGEQLAQLAQPSTDCIFGEDIGEISENKRFVVSDEIIKTFKLSRIDKDQTPMVAITVIKDTVTKKEYQMNTTFRHRDDGDNTIGWIEEVTGAADDENNYNFIEGKLVAAIGDSSIYNCTEKF